MDNNQQIGFTLIEMLLVLLLLAILAGAGSRAIASGFDAYFTAKTLSNMADGGHLALARLMAELQDSSCDNLSRPAGSDSLQFINSSGNTLFVNASQTQNDTLTIQINGGLSKTLLSNVNNVEFTYSDNAYNHGCLVTIKITLFKTLNGAEVITLPIRSAIYLHVGQSA
ncbi:MAG: prepilin-type N-terminal cleavage/methylation domain-containing protein [Magnetococcales bacterium]|nr:prepilin-type N-terminal cleavage/methylation domain-containing protein [Magnetococcales bacterium]